MTASPSTTVAGTSGVSWQTGAHRVHVDLELHLPEIQRRRATNAAGSVQDLDTLRFLLTLPVDQPTALAGLDAYERRLARRAVRCGFAEERAVARSQSTLIRRAEPPVTVRLISVFGPFRRSTLQLATTFAPYGRRRLVVPSGRLDEILLLEATFYGVGVTVADANGERTVTASAPFQPARFTGASWLFAERIYGQALSSATATGQVSAASRS